MGEQNDIRALSALPLAPLLDALRALRACATTEALARATATAALELGGCGCVALLLAQESAWPVVASAGAALPAQAHSLPAGDDLIRQIARQDELIAAGASAPSLAALLPAPYSHEALIYALPGQGAPRGALVCGYAPPGAGAAQRLALGALAVAAAQEFERLRLGDEIARRDARLRQHERMQAALEAIEAIGHGEQIRRLIHAALVRILAALELPDGGVYLYDQQSGDLVLIAAHPRQGVVAAQGARLPLAAYDHSLPVRAAAARQALAAPLQRANGSVRPPSDLPSLALPLLATGHLLGILQVATPQKFSRDHETTAATLAERLAAAIERAQRASLARLEQERAHALVDATNDAILLLDPQGCAILINRRAKYFFGLAERDVIGRTPAQLRAIFHMIFEDGPAFDAWLTPLLASSEERAVIELKVLRAEPRILQCFTAPVPNERGRLLGRLLVFRDITREREVERMKNEFVSIVSHELRTPLTSIRGALQLVLGRPQHAEPLSPRIRELLDISLKNTERLIRLVTDILDIAKIEQGRIQLRRVPLDPEELCRTAAQGVAAFADSRDVAIEVAVDSTLPPVSADRDRALQVLTNLLSNAIKFSEAGQCIVLSASPSPGAVCFTVRDQGRGIAIENQQQIFEKFQQIDSSLTREAGGTGLGLAICKALIEQHGGRIWVESAPDQGSSFSFTLPLAPGAEPTPQRPGRPTVLVVDDKSLMRDLLRAMLEEQGFAVAEASSGSEGVTLARLLHPTLITLDIMMPGLDGFDVIQVLRNDPLTREIPVLFISAIPEHERGLALGGDGFLLKPFTPEELLAQVHRLVEPPPRRVLVVDDDAHVRPALARLLRQGGFEAIEAVSGQEAIEQVQHAPPDLIVLDIRMPDMDGYEVLRRLKQHPQHRHIPVVILTGSDLGEEARRRAAELGAICYLEKPIASDELLAAIERSLM